MHDPACSRNGLNLVGRQYGGAIRAETDKKLGEARTHVGRDEEIRDGIAEARQGAGHMAIISDQGMTPCNPCARFPQILYSLTLR